MYTGCGVCIQNKLIKSKSTIIKGERGGITVAMQLLNVKHYLVCQLSHAIQQPTTILHPAHTKEHYIQL